MQPKRFFLFVQGFGKGDVSRLVQIVFKRKTLQKKTELTKVEKEKLLVYIRNGQRGIFDQIKSVDTSYSMCSFTFVHDDYILPLKYLGIRDPVE